MFSFHRRFFVLILCVVAILWIPLVKSSQGGQLFNYIQAVQGYLGTPIGALFILGVLWTRMNERVSFITPRIYSFLFFTLTYLQNV